MKWEHKIGIAISCTFLCLVGAVIGLKMQIKTPSEAQSMVAVNPPKNETSIPPEHEPVPSDDPKSTQTTPPRGLVKRRSAITPDSLSKGDPALDPTGLPARRSAVSETSSEKQKTSQPAERTKANGNSPTFMIAGPTSSDQLESKDTGTRLISVEQTPTLPPVAGANQWGLASPDKPKKEKDKPTPPAQKDPKAQPTGATPKPDTKQAQAENILPPAAITAASGHTSMMSFEPTPVPPRSFLTPKGSGSSLSANPSLPSKSATATPPPAPNIVSAFPERSAPPPKPLDSKANNTTPPPTLLPSGKAQDIPKLASPPMQPPSALMPPTLSSATPPPIPPSITAPPPPAMPIPTPVAFPGSITPPASVAPASPPPPKPPAEGSAFIPERSSPAPGPVGVKPAPLPLPTPPSSPLTSAPIRPALPRPASSGPSVTVYDEQDYSCQPGDSWAAISKHFYLTDRYAKALQRHNENHARASEGIRDTGQIAAGERIFVPQAYVLEQRYADAITKPATAPTTMPAGYVPTK